MKPGHRPTGPTRREIVRGIAGELERAGLESPAAEAERLVAHALELSRSELVTRGDERVDPAEALRVAKAVSRRLEREPLQHIEGEVEFRRLTLVSDGRALIPRPETEQLVDRIGAWVAEHGRPERALDIGTGSGAIALALLEEDLAGRVLAIDVSRAALSQARSNAVRANPAVADRLELAACVPAIWPSVAGEPPFGLIVSNPPYVATGEWEALDPTVRDHEPRSALDGGPDGLEIVRRIVAGAAAHLVPGGGLFLEIGAEQGPAVLEILNGAAGLQEASVASDLAGRTRFAHARRSAASDVVS